jgi:hypothetical protein
MLTELNHFVKVSLIIEYCRFNIEYYRESEFFDYF